MTNKKILIASIIFFTTSCVITIFCIEIYFAYKINKPFDNPPTSIITIDTFCNQYSDWELLETAIIWQETKGNPYPKNSHGDSEGLYQITPIYVKEVNRILGYEKYLPEDRKDPIKSKEMFDILQNHHNPDKDIRKAIKLHNKGDKYYQEVMDKFRMLKFNQHKTK